MHTLTFATSALLMSLASEAAVANDDLTTTLSKASDGNWSVRYDMTQPVSQIELHRSPDQSRAQRWELNDAFQILYENDREYLRREDGAYFTQVKAELTPTYIALDKEYAPFSPFSDGGMLVHSGRFFACTEHCTEDHTKWKIRIELAADEYVIVNGQRYQGSASWMDSDSGQKIYVGDAKPQDDGPFISMVDPELPQALRNLMAEHLPELMTFFAEHLPQPETTPQLYASFSPTTDGRYGHQGGVLPNQVFMHWYGFVDESMAESTLWFFAHEAAHLYQKQAYSSQPHEAWLHEGSAELFAGLAMQHFEQGHDMLKQTLKSATAACTEGVSEGMSFHQAAAANSRLHYSCGLVLFEAMHRDLVNQDKDIFALWRDYSDAVDNGGEASEDLFLEIAAGHLTPEAHAKLVELLGAEQQALRSLVE
ncbi:hypothetical protein CWE09_01880 [Aliidiomarina minuta]|uniref:Peptidase M1 membrane alanine aminopeptidase domain-containing protein n=1 Tax=Aliidiomarina minuta TaxID=880057 RepID=A0A432W659_9GAMM|nr:hypothetical protein [Aliidiomarina minuta]RUO25511.1 hypothetical protein CWE09_01880 [Aliidiomarina minuta]